MSSFNLDGDKKKDKVFVIARDLIFETNLSKRLQGLEVLIGMIDEEFKIKCDYEKHFVVIQRFKNDKDFLREMRLVSIITDNIETAIEYYGKDYLNGDDFAYREDFEKKRAIIDKNINEFLGKLLLEITTTEDFLI